MDNIACPKCQSGKLTFFGKGTQKIEKEIGKYFHRARIIRVDSDSVRQMRTADNAYRAFEAGDGDILVGTQMVLKEIKSDNIGLVGIVSADTGLQISDFRSSERTFDMIAEIIRKARASSGIDKVIVQTYDPDNNAIKDAVEGEYERFYKEELKSRQELGYPPYSQMMNILVYGKDEKLVAGVARGFGEKIKKSELVNVLGPVKAPIEKLRGKFRRMILLKGPDHASIREAFQEAMKGFVYPREIRIVYDIEPLSII